MAPPLCRLYLLTPPRLDDLAGFGRALAHALDAGDVAALQIRLKDHPPEVIAAAVDALSPIAQARGVAGILNDDPAPAPRPRLGRVPIRPDRPPPPRAPR